MEIVSKQLKATTHKESEQDTIQDTVQDKKLIILKYCMVPRSRIEMQDYLGLKNRSHFTNEYLKPLLEEQLLEMKLPNTPTSKNQRYRTTEKGRELLDE